jgi:hypothetical protein
VSSQQSDLRKTFNRILDAVVAGKINGCPSDSGLDQETVTMLNTLAALPIPKRARDVHAVRVEFGRMLDGTHAREADAASLEAWRQIVNDLPRNGVQDIGQS